MSDEYGRLRDSAEGPDTSYGNLNDVSVDQKGTADNDYLKPGASLGYDYQLPVGVDQREDEGSNHEYHEVDGDKEAQDHEYHEVDGDKEAQDHEYHEVDGDKEVQDHEYHEVGEDKKDDGYEHPPNFDHEYHELSDIPDKTATLDIKNTPNVEFDSLQYGVFRNGSQAALLNSNQNNSNNNNNATSNVDGEYMHVTDDMLLPPHKRGNSMQAGTTHLSSPATEL